MNTLDSLEQVPTANDTSIKLPRFVVGIGASAGGLESLEKLFRNLPTDTGMAFVVLQHLSPDFKSMMLELLKRDTAMNIHCAEDGMPLEANCVYLLPPKKEMILAGGQLYLSDKDPSKGLALPIDHFLESLARECGPKAIAIILSGSGSDGSRGIVDIAREGGYVISESVETAKFDGMPSSAQTSGVVDGTLAPEEIGELLARLATQPDTTRRERMELDATIEELETSNEELQATNEELIASNEELQSTNEELHLVNEELYTVNAEHQRKISELAELNQDMHHLLENTDVAIVFLDRDLRIRRFTSHVQTVFDLVEQDVGRPISSFLPKFQVDDLMKRLRQVLDDSESYECETQTQDGTCYLLRLLPYRASGTVSGVVLMLVDVSSLEVLRDRLRWMSAIVESTEDAIIGQDLRGKITSWNSGAERLYGYATTEAIGRNVSMLIPEESNAEVIAYRNKIATGSPLHSTDTIRIHKDGKPIHVSLTISPVRDSLNRTIGISKIARDISKRIEMENQIQQQVRQQEAFLATLSHELRNPLGAILSASHIISDGRAEHSSLVQAALIIQRQVGMTCTLLEDLLDVSRIALGKIDLRLAQLDLCELVSIVDETTHSEIVRHENKLAFHAPTKPLYVSGDATRLVQIQVNLIQNAAKYSPNESTITVTLEREQDWAVISVTDEGVGIASEQLIRIFDLFVQIGDSQSQRSGGLGVGLTVVKTLVEIHGGHVRAESNGLGCGSTFKVYLPCINEFKIDSTISDCAALLISPSKVSPTPLRIVLIEDIDDNREMLKTILELDGHTVFEAANGEAGFELIQSRCPDVALVDIGLPGIDGHQVARSVRETSETCFVKLIALTGYGQSSDIAKAHESGFDSHLTKPVDPVCLADLLAKVVKAQGSAKQSLPIRWYSIDCAGGGDVPHRHYPRSW